MVDKRCPDQRNYEESHLAEPRAPFMYGLGYDIAVQLDAASAAEQPLLATRDELVRKINRLSLLSEAVMPPEPELGGEATPSQPSED